MCFRRSISVIITVIAMVAGPVLAQVEASEDIQFSKRNLGGPRFGVTVVPGNGTLVDELEKQGLVRIGVEITTQFKSTWIG